MTHIPVCASVIAFFSEKSSTIHTASLFYNVETFSLVFAMDVGGWAAGDVVIVAAQRTPIGSLNGNLSSHKASSLGTIVIESLLKKNNVSPADISEVILGQALTAGNF